MVIGTIFTLFVVPAVYTLVAKVHKRLEERDPETLPIHQGEPAPLAAPLSHRGH